MDAPAIRAAKTALLLVVAGAGALAIAASVGSTSQPDPRYLAAADGAVLAAKATPQPIAAASPTAVFQPSAGDHSVRDGAPGASRLRMSADGVITMTVKAPAASAAPATPAKPAKPPKPAKVVTVAAPRPPMKAAAPASYHGTNHVWIPALGINRAVTFFPCDRVAPPDTLMYRWGCAGSNNVYLLGHAYAPMKPLHDAYARGTLRVGMRAVYADSAGTIHTYAITWWKVTLPTTDAAWAWAPQSVPSMTLQTCVGAKSEYRLMVRLVEVGN